MSDPKGVEEWRKQLGTFSVGRIGRSFNVDEPKEHVIQLSADFTEERPFFALTEYISWANEQISQNKKWADKSKETNDGKEFWYPWHSLKGNITVEGNLPRPVRFEFDRGRLLNLLVGHTIYNEPNVAIRELLQNSIDAVRYQHFIDSRESSRVGAESPRIGCVTVRWNQGTRELVIEDNGTGMDKEVIESHLMKVGSSFYDTAQFKSNSGNFTPISRFGIGTLTCFMISDDIEIVTNKGGSAHRIKMTSVHSDYLMKSLPSGDSALKSIEPHGTIVRLKLRASVDLTSASILDILRFWIILPACPVFYIEEEQDTVHLGFSNVDSAMRELYSSSHAKPEQMEKNYEVRNAMHERDGEVYRLSYIVRRSYGSEWTFSGNVRSAVCIEGIRVDNSLPYFSFGIGGLLAVTGNRKFRTTVSRMTLEKDDEYIKAGKICVDLLFQHIRSEVERIANQSGDPVSQASSAGAWLYKTLSTNVAGPVSEYLNDLYNDLPVVVIENNEVKGKKFTSSRKLCSLNEIRQLDSFWTIESRSVDYIGVISRDLGRELTVGEFLGSLSPDLQSQIVNPIIPDMNMFLNEINDSHEVTFAEFSRQHQRTLLKWSPKSTRSYINTVVGDINFLYHFDNVTSRVNLNRYAGARIPDQKGRVTFYNTQININKIAVASMKGDIQDVTAIKTRFVTVINASTIAGNVFSNLDLLLEKITSANGSIVDSVLVIALKWYFSTFISQRVREMGGLSVTEGWSDSYEQANMLFEKYDINFSLPANLKDIIPADQWFSASSYWRNWFGDQNQQY